MKKAPTSFFVFWIGILLGIFQLIREIFGLGTWQMRGYIERYEGASNLVIHLFESPGIWMIICCLCYYNIHKKGGQLLWGLIAIQLFLFFAMYMSPMAKIWLIVVWALFAYILYDGYKSRPQEAAPDILDDPDF